VSRYTLSDYIFQFITVTIGVLIALFINGLVEWNENRELVRDARATILREIADNKRDLEATLSGIPKDIEGLESATKFASDLLTTKKTAITALGLHLNLADLSSSSWRTAERTGALSHMDYAEVQTYSKLYDFQDLIIQQQRSMLSQLASASAIISSDFNPDDPNPKDLEVFRERVMALRSTLGIHQDMATRLVKNYAEALAQ
jgi:hypothetical protein